MPKTAESTLYKACKVVKSFPGEFAITSGCELFCIFCEEIVTHKKKFFVDQHRSTAKHQKNIFIKSSSPESVSPRVAQWVQESGSLAEKTIFQGHGHSFQGRMPNKQASMVLDLTSNTLPTQQNLPTEPSNPIGELMLPAFGPKAQGEVKMPTLIPLQMPSIELSQGSKVCSLNPHFTERIQVTPPEKSRPGVKSSQSAFAPVPAVDQLASVFSLEKQFSDIDDKEDNPTLSSSNFMEADSSESPAIPAPGNNPNLPFDPMDSFNVFGQHIANELRQLPSPQLQRLAKLRIQQLIYDLSLSNTN